MESSQVLFGLLFLFFTGSCALMELLAWSEAEAAGGYRTNFARRASKWSKRCGILALMFLAIFIFGFVT